MPKMKSNSGAKKRFSFTAKGKVKYRKSHRNHILTKKTTKRLRHLRKGSTMNAVETDRVKLLLPYGG
ncbi:MAG: 50S ribosomal protein L35 [Deltaproteobacteria bacterium]|nr:50S ribosomal protein L35 [Deltaproteobacteria bacterium]